MGLVPFCCEFGAGLDVDGFKYIFKVFPDGAWRDAKFESDFDVVFPCGNEFGNLLLSFG